MLNEAQAKKVILQIRGLYNMALDNGLMIEINSLRPVMQLGVVEVKLGNEVAYNWLVEVSGQLEPGVPIAGRIINRMERRIKYTSKMLAEMIGQRTLLRLIGMGNPGILVADWKILSSKLMEDGFHQLVTLSLSQAAGDQLENVYRRRIRLGCNGIVELWRRNLGFRGYTRIFTELELISNRSNQKIPQDKGTLICAFHRFDFRHKFKKECYHSDQISTFPRSNIDILLIKTLSYGHQFGRFRFHKFISSLFLNKQGW